jgi:hypothetical protein
MSCCVRYACAYDRIVCHVCAALLWLYACCYAWLMFSLLCSVLTPVCAMRASMALPLACAAALSVFFLAHWACAVNLRAELAPDVLGFCKNIGIMGTVSYRWPGS